MASVERWLLGGVAGGAALLVYLRSTYSGVPGGDSGELLAEACQGGSPHPPGYPLFTLLSMAAQTLTGTVAPQVTPAQAVNLLCSAFGALSVLFIVLAAHGLVELDPRQAQSERHHHTHDRPGHGHGMEARRGRVSTFVLAFARSFGPTLAGLLYAFAPLTWEFTVGTEVFALNNVLCAALVYLTVRVVHYRSWTDVYLGALVSGLALANQHTSLLLVSVLVTAVGGHYMWAKWTWSRFAVATAAFCVGISPYAYLVISSMVGPKPGSWGDQSTVTGFMRHVLRSEYGTFKLGVGRTDDVDGAGTRIVNYLHHTNTEYGGFQPAMGLCGVAMALYLFLSAGNTRLYGRTAQSAGSSSSGGEVEEQAAQRPQPSKKQQQKKKPTRKQRQHANGSDTGAGATRNSQPQPGGRGADAPQNAGTDTGTETGTATTTDGEKQTSYLALPTVLAVAWVSYTLVWHGVLSNLPLNVPMAFAVHSRFWIQPNALLAVLAGWGIHYMVSSLCWWFASGEGPPSSMTRRSTTTRTGWGGVLLGQVVSAVIVAQTVQAVFPYMDRSAARGHMMQDYGAAMLQALPQQSLLLSHTDLDWNTVRYLRVCEHQRPDVSHVSLQLVPYPWFSRQHDTDFYGNISFTPSFRGISTDRQTEGNTRLVHDMLVRNMPTFGDRIFLDMQSVNERDIGVGGAFHNLTLLPWGPVYRVVHQLSLDEQMQWLDLSSAQLDSLEQRVPLATHPKAAQELFGLGHDRVFFAGTWEFAARSVFQDAHYQLALHRLTLALDMLQEPTAKQMPWIIRTLAEACPLLQDSWLAVRRMGTLSSAPSDVVKNNALCWARLVGVVNVVAQFPASGETVLRDMFPMPPPPTGSGDTRTEADWDVDKLLEGLIHHARGAVATFAREVPDDADAKALASTIDATESRMMDRHRQAMG